MKTSSRLWIALALATAITSSSGCAAEVTYLRPEVAIPARPDPVRIPAEALACLSDETYAGLVKRDATWQAHVGELEAIIRALADQPTE